MEGQVAERHVVRYSFQQRTTHGQSPYTHQQESTLKLVLGISRSYDRSREETACECSSSASRMASLSSSAVGSGSSSKENTLSPEGNMKETE